MKRQSLRVLVLALAAVWLIGCGSATLLFEDVRRLVIPPGSLDGSFGGGDGIATAHLSSQDEGYAVAVQPDGKIVVAGYYAPGNIAVLRFTAAGVLDSSFGGGDGMVTTDLGGDDIARAVAIQADGKIVVVGSDSRSIPPADIAVLRYTSSGVLDDTFSSDGIVETNLGSLDWGYAVALQTDGKIVVAGTSDADFVTLRYETDGDLDPLFGAAGVARTSIAATDMGRSVAIQPLDQKIVTAGFYYNGSENVFVALRYGTNGTLDTSFDGDGIALANFVGVPDEEARSVAIQTDGKVVIGGHSATSTEFALVRLNANGTVDTDFGDNGFIRTAYENASIGESVAILPDGRILLAGSSYDGTEESCAVVRYLADGSVDPSFGIRTHGFPSGDCFGQAVALQEDGKILVAGYVYSGGNYDFALLRILP